jgi:hypothetical protein
MNAKQRKTEEKAKADMAKRIAAMEKKTNKELKKIVADAADAFHSMYADAFRLMFDNRPGRRRADLPRRTPRRRKA